MLRDAIIYCRISRDKTGAGLGVERQREDCYILATTLGLNVIDVYTDNDLSAYSGKPRPGYLKLLKDIAAGRVTAVVIWHPDRLHRSPVELERYIAVCQLHGVDTFSVQAGHYDLSTPTGRMQARISGAVARQESEHKAERLKRKKDQMAEHGEWKGGRRPFGYEADGVTIRPAEAAVLAQAAEEFISGRTLNSIAKEWNTQGVTTSTGRPWSMMQLRRVLLRPRNAGIMEHRGEEAGRASWDAILDETTWRAVCAILADPSRKTTPGPARRWLGSGIYECGVCEHDGASSVRGGPVRVIAATAGQQIGGIRTTVPAYRCSRDRNNHPIRHAIHLDKYVTMVALEWLGQHAGSLRLGVRDDAAARARAIERETIRVREAEAAELFAAGTITGAQLTAICGAFNRRRTELDAADAAGARASSLIPFQNGDAAAVWDGLDLDRRRAVVSEIMRVVILPTGRGRPRGWTPKYGREWGYFDPSSIRIERREGA